VKTADLFLWIFAILGDLFVWIISIFPSLRVCNAKVRVSASVMRYYICKRIVNAYTQSIRIANADGQGGNSQTRKQKVSNSPVFKKLLLSAKHDNFLSTP